MRQAQVGGSRTPPGRQQARQRAIMVHKLLRLHTHVLCVIRNGPTSTAAPAHLFQVTMRSNSWARASRCSSGCSNTAANLRLQEEDV